MMNQTTASKVRFAFFGTSHIAVYVLDALEHAGLTPTLVVTQPPKPKGRGLVEQSTDVQTWADARGIPVAHDVTEFEKEKWDVAIVVDYGLLIDKSTLATPRRGFLNVHPSLLPRLRGASPMRSAILNDEKETGVTIMQLSEGMDEGPIVAQKKIMAQPWPLKNSELEALLLPMAGQLLAQILPLWIHGEIEAKEQNHDLATYCDKLSKEDGLLDLSADGYKNLLKIKALEGWPGTYTFFERGGKKLRMQILDAHMDNKKLVIDRVKPEGKKEMAYEEFLRSGAKTL
jgi:methionyl-tRNA formyltransferase